MRDVLQLKNWSAAARVQWYDLEENTQIDRHFFIQVGFYNWENRPFDIWLNYYRRRSEDQS